MASSSALPERFVPTQRFVEAHLELFPEHYRDLFAFAAAGSHLYGLQREGSDRDLMVVTAGRGKGYARMVGIVDIKVQTFEHFIFNLWDTSPLDVDALRADSFTVVAEAWKPMLSSFRFAEGSYLKRARAEITQDVSNVLRAGGATSERAAKALKVALRTSFLCARVERDGQAYRPTFTAEQRVYFYETLTEVTRALQTSPSRSSLEATMALLAQEEPSSY